MTNLGSEDAARQLAEIEARQAAALKRVLVPAWYWWVVGGLMILLGGSVDFDPPVAIAISATVFAVLVTGLSIWAITGGLTGARARSELVGGRGALGMVALDFLVVGVSLAVAFGSRAEGFHYPGLLGTACGAVLLVAGGPFLMRWLERVMRERAAR